MQSDEVLNNSAQGDRPSTQVNADYERLRMTGSAVINLSRSHLTWTDCLILIAFCSLLFGYVATSGRPMTLHEARLPECSREMLARHDWLVPMNGPRPWLERPPLPHWIMMTVATVLGQRCDNEWSARIPPALMGLLIVLMVARVAAAWLGRNMGMLAGLALATMYEFYYYSTLAEDDIFLAFVVVATMTLWIEMEFFRDPGIEDKRQGFLGARPWQVIAFFILLGLTNLAKGPIVGAAVIVAPLAVYLFWQLDWRRMRRYIWLWGWIAAAAVALSWHVFIQKRYPEYLENLKYDFSHTSDFDEPFWYYPPQLLGIIMPWTPAAIVGLVIAVQNAFRRRDAISRFLVSWAIVPVLVLSVPHRKHHHYLVPSLAPWAILAAIGSRQIVGYLFSNKRRARNPLFGTLVVGLPVALAIVYILPRKIPWPIPVTLLLAATWITCVAFWFIGITRRDGRWVLASIVLCVGVFFNFGQTYWPDPNVADTLFLKQANALTPKDQPLIVNGSIGPLDFFRIQFYLRPDAKLIHNLTYLRGNDIISPDAWIISRAGDEDVLKEFGQVSMPLVSPHTRRETGPKDRFALFHIHFDPNLKRYPPPPVSPMQAMLRKPGPECGPKAN